ncbi:hypothetical protein TRIP_B200792 [uncultured Desulfatiglans sp.]|uniref:Uncharacterized protein n=1 Tax=Uncultured Desulfatiglans sp. TaxID=1748965 RepID=A0A653A4R8_UNCDX|nr:hypothetical protein TRIP_B200792 [uncultured Desulfatiglans sp.]
MEKIYLSASTTPKHRRIDQAGNRVISTGNMIRRKTNEKTYTIDAVPVVRWPSKQGD